MNKQSSFHNMLCSLGLSEPEERDVNEQDNDQASTEEDKNMLFAEVIGWYGMIALITAYGLTSFNVIASTGYVYQLLNLTGAIGLMIIAYKKHVFQSVFLNIFWVAIGVVAISKLLL